MGGWDGGDELSTRSSGVEYVENLGRCCWAEDQI